MSKKTKVWLIIATSLIIVGGIIFGGGMTMIKWDFKKLSTVKYENNTYKIEENYKNISIITNTADVVIEPSQDGTHTVECYELANEKHMVVVEDGTLAIEISNTKKWYENIGISIGTPKITVRIPEGQYEEISVKVSTGDIDMKNLSADLLDFTVSTGKLAVTSVRCKNFTSNGSTGRVVLNDVIATEKMQIKRNTGNLRFDRCDAAELLIETSTGDVRGSLLTEKVFVVKTSTGNIEVPESTTGGKCKVRTTTGNIEIRID